MCCYFNYCHLCELRMNITAASSPKTHSISYSDILNLFSPKTKANRSEFRVCIQNSKPIEWLRQCWICGDYVHMFVLFNWHDSRSAVCVRFLSAFIRSFVCLFVPCHFSFCLVLSIHANANANTQKSERAHKHTQREIWLERANVYAVCHLHFHTERERVGVVCTYNLHHSSCVSATHNYRKWTFGWQNKWFYLSGHKFKIIEVCVCAFDAGFCELEH